MNVLADNGNQMTPIERLMAISWVENPARFKSSLRLTEEFIRRMSLWATRLDCEKRYFRSWVHFDVANLINPTIRAIGSDIIALDNYNMSHRAYFPSTSICEWYLHWEALIAQDPLSISDLPAPYDPLILMFERSGLSIGFEHGWLTIGASILMGLNRNIDMWTSLSPLVELDNSVLDAIDAAVT